MAPALGDEFSLWTLVNRDIYRAWVKRAIDIVAGGTLLVLFSPVIIAAWVAVRLTSKGPGFFRQGRVGKDRSTIYIYKLRSMYVDQDTRVDMTKVREFESQGKVYKSDNDPRVTGVGRFLRKTSIDELPQLWNVVRGDMSLVGPRPLVPHMLAAYPELAAERSRVRPGITGLWQVSARTDNTSVDGMVKYDLGYVERHSFMHDLWILVKTPFVVAFTTGAQ